MSIKNSDDAIGNRIRDLPVCSAVPQPTAPPRVPATRTVQSKTVSKICVNLDFTHKIYFRMN